MCTHQCSFNFQLFIYRSVGHDSYALTVCKCVYNVSRYGMYFIFLWRFGNALWPFHQWTLYCDNYCSFKWPGKWKLIYCKYNQQKENRPKTVVKDIMCLGLGMCPWDQNKGLSKDIKENIWQRRVVIHGIDSDTAQSVQQNCPSTSIQVEKSFPWNEEGCRDGRSWERKGVAYIFDFYHYVYWPNSSKSESDVVFEKTKM